MQLQFGFGVGFDRDNQPINAGFAAKALKQILMEASRMYGGCNLVRGQGAWVDSQGTLILEDSCTLTVNVIQPGRFGSESGVEDRAKADQLASFIRAELNQTAVYITQLVSSTRFVWIGGNEHASR